MKSQLLIAIPEKLVEGMLEERPGRKQQIGTRSISHARPFSREKYCPANDIMKNRFKKAQTASFFFIMCPYLLFSSTGRHYSFIIAGY